MLDIVCHKILERKLRHIGIEEESIELIMDYLKNRKQVVEINANISDTLLTGPYSVSQGSILSGLLYTIFTLDMHGQTHPKNHKTHEEYTKCNNTEINTFVDDTYLEENILVKNTTLCTRTPKPVF